MSNFLENQNWRYATKKFDATKKISTDDLNFLKEAIRLSSSSFGLQLYKVIIIDNNDVRAKLLSASYGQTQIVDASQVIVFANFTHANNDDIDAYLKNVVETRNLPAESMTGYGEYMKGAIGYKSDDEKNVWNEKQTYLALGNLLNAAADLKIDVCPMEGFVASQYNEILGLNELNLNASLVATIGYRSDEDATQHYKKVRKSNSDLFITI